MRSNTAEQLDWPLVTTVPRPAPETELALEQPPLRDVGRHPGAAGWSARLIVEELCG